MSVAAPPRPLAVVDRRSPGQPRFELRESAMQASARLDDSTLVVGYMADVDGVPLERLPPGDRLGVADANLTDATASAGGWLVLARRGTDLLLRTDLFGSRPVFWRHTPDRTEVHETIWPLAQGAALDPLGVADMLLVGHHLGDRTLFANVRSSVGHALVRFGHEADARHFDWPAPMANGTSLNEATAALEAALERIYEPYADLEGLLVPLSGGLDSRTLLALAVDHGVPVRAWTMVMRSGTQEERIARAVARRLGVEHSVTWTGPAELEALAPAMVDATSGQLSLEHAHVFGPHLTAPDTYAVAVNGIYGDLFCGGSYLGAPGLDPAAARAERVDQLLGGRSLESLQRRLPGAADWGERLREHVAQGFARVGNDPRRADLLVVADRPSRFNAWGSIAMRPRYDYIAPFLDRRLMQAAYGIPEQWRRESRAYKLVIARRWPDLARIPWAKTGLPVAGGRARLLRYRIERRAWRRPRTFVDADVYWTAFGELAEAAVSELAAPLTAVGIDLPGLCADEPPETRRGQELRLRAAACLLALRRAGAIHS